MKAFCVGFPGWMNSRLDVMLVRPTLKVRGDMFRTVIHPQVFGISVLAGDILEFCDDGDARKRKRTEDRETEPAAFVKQRMNAELAAMEKPICKKVHRPDLVRCGGTAKRQASNVLCPRAAAPAIELKIPKSVEPSKTFKVHIRIGLTRLTLVPVVQPSATAPRPSLRKLGEPRDDSRIFLGFRARLGPWRSSAHAHDLAGRSLAQPRLLQRLHRFLPL